MPTSGHLPPTMCSLRASPAPRPEPEPVRIHGSEGGGGLGDDRGVVAEGRTGDTRPEAQRRACAERAHEGPGEGALALLRCPRVEVLADHEPGLEARGLGLGAPVEQLGRMELLEHRRVADRGHGSSSCAAPSRILVPLTRSYAVSPRPARGPTHQDRCANGRFVERRPLPLLPPRVAGAFRPSRPSRVGPAAARGRPAAPARTAAPRRRDAGPRGGAQPWPGRLRLRSSARSAAGRPRSGAARTPAGRGRARVDPNARGPRRPARRSSFLSSPSSAIAPAAGSGPAGTSTATTALWKSGWSVTPHGAVTYRGDTPRSRTPGRLARASTAHARVAGASPTFAPRPM